MSKIKQVVFTLLLFFIVGSTFGQGQKGGSKFDRHEEFHSKKIAFLTEYVDITPAEAIEFWPLYNELFKKMKASFDLEKSLEEKLRGYIEEGVEDGYKTVIDSLLEVKLRNVEESTAYYNKFRTILSEEKVAKVLIGEREFREQMMRQYRNSEKSDRSKR